MSTRRATFGPGSLESVTLSMWRRQNHGTIRVRLDGTFSFYCGNGGEHREVLSIRHSYARSASQSAYDGDEDAQADLAHELVNWWAEENYTDPCEDVEEEDDSESAWA